MTPPAAPYSHTAPLPAVTVTLYVARKLDQRTGKFSRFAGLAKLVRRVKA